MDKVEGGTAGARALMQVQRLEVQGKVSQALVFWDTGSNVNLVRQEFARLAGWEGRPVVQWLQSTGRDAEEWRTIAYKATLVNHLGWDHSILVFEIGTIKAALKPVDVEPVMVLFAGEIPDLYYVRRPVGEVDLLIEVQQAGLFPVVADLERHRVGNMGLLTSDFKTGNLLDGVHPALGPSALFQTQEAFERSHSILGSTKFEAYPGNSPDTRLPREIYVGPDAKFPEEIYKSPDAKISEESPSGLGGRVGQEACSGARVQARAQACAQARAG